MLGSFEGFVICMFLFKNMGVLVVMLDVYL